MHQVSHRYCHHYQDWPRATTKVSRLSIWTAQTMISLLGSTAIPLPLWVERCQLQRRHGLAILTGRLPTCSCGGLPHVLPIGNMQPRRRHSSSHAASSSVKRNIRGLSLHAKKDSQAPPTGTRDTSSHMLCFFVRMSRHELWDVPPYANRP